MYRNQEKEEEQQERQNLDPETLKNQEEEPLQRQSENVERLSESHEISFWKWQVKDQCKYIYNILGFALSIGLGLVLQYLIMAINLHFSQKLPEPVFTDSIGMINILISSAGGQLINGFNQGMGAFVGRAFGNRDRDLINDYYTKGVFHYLLSFFGFSLIIFNCRSLFLVLNQDEEVASMSQYYGVSILFGLLCNYFTDMQRCYLNAQKIYIAPMVIEGIFAIFHYISCQLLFETYGIDGIIWSTNMTYFFTWLCFQIYTYKVGLFPTLKFGNIFDKNYKGYLVETSQIAMVLQLSIILYGMNGFIAGGFQDLETLSAHITFSNFDGILFAFSIGLSGSSIYLTSIAIGRKSLQGVKNVLTCVYIIGLAQGVLFFFILRVFIDDVAYLYCECEDWQSFRDISVIYSYGVIFLNIGVALRGVLKGAGLAKLIMYVITIGFNVFGIAGSLICSLVLDYQIYGLWYGYTIALISTFFGYHIVWYFTDFQKQINIIHASQLSQEEKEK